MSHEVDEDVWEETLEYIENWHGDLPVKFSSMPSSATSYSPRYSLSSNSQSTTTKDLVSTSPPSTKEPIKMSSAALNKIAPNSTSRASPSELEVSIANALHDLETNIPDMRSALRPLQFVTAREIEVGHGRKAIIIFVPIPLLQQWHKSQQRLTRELEKKFSDRHVLIIASRRILPRPKRSNRSRTTQTQKRPRSRTLKAVYDSILSDLVYPVEIVGRRCLQRVDGSRVVRIILDEKERGSVDYRLDTYTEVYKRLTGTTVNFEFPLAEAAGYYAA